VTPWLLLLLLPVLPSVAAPAPVGRLVDLGGQRLHLNCTGRGSPTVVVENGLGDFSFDWVLVQHPVSSFARVCTYDRGGYAWSDPGPLPRTFDQLNFELRKALARAGERGPYVLVGHSFGGGVVRQHALRFPSDVAGVVFVDIVSEHQFIRMGPHAGRVGDDAKAREIPAPREGAAGETTTTAPHPEAASIEPPYDRLPRKEQELHAWASVQPMLTRVEDSQREWSAEYFARWAATSQKGSLGAIPLIVLTRADGGYGKNLDRPEEELERARLDAQRALKDLSSAGTQRVINAGHNMHLEVPAAVVQAIRDVITSAR
jgi:pimeloyl-ACP methyl ester carboxylesterase